MKKIILLLIGLTIVSSIAYFYLATDSTIVKCKESETSTPYCTYKGKVKSVYMNGKGLILIGIYKTIDKNQASSVGFELTTTNYFAYQLTDANREFSQAIMSLSETALTEDKSIEMHARETLNGMIKIDRIWLLND